METETNTKCHDTPTTIPFPASKDLHTLAAASPLLVGPIYLKSLLAECTPCPLNQYLTLIRHWAAA